MKFTTLVSGTLTAATLVGGGILGLGSIRKMNENGIREKQELADYTKSVNAMSLDELAAESIHIPDTEIRMVADQVLATAKNLSESPDNATNLLQRCEDLSRKVGNASHSESHGKFTFNPDKKPLQLAVAILDKAREEYYNFADKKGIDEGDKYRLTAMTKATFNAQDAVNSLSDYRGVATR